MGLTSGRTPRHLISRVWKAFDGLAEDTLWAAASDLYGVVAALASFYLLQGVLDEVGYGPFFGLYGIVGPLGSLTFAGPGLALLQRHYRHNQPKNEILRSFLSLTLSIGLATSTVAIVIALIFIDLTPIEILLIVSSELLASSTIFVCAWLAQIAVGFPAMARVRMGAVTLKLLSVLGLSVLGILSIRNLAACYLVLYSAYVYWLLTRYLPSIGFTIRLRKPQQDTAADSAVFAVPMVASSIQLDGDKFALNAFGLKADAGLYGAAFRVILLGALPIRVVGQAAFHRFLPEEQGGAGQSLGKIIKLTGIMFGIGLTVAMGFRIFEPILAFIFRDGFKDSVSIVRWLLFLLPMIALSEIPLNGLLSLGKANERAAVYILSSLFSISTYVMLIPGRGWEGAVAATLMSEAYLIVAAWISLLYLRKKAMDDEARSRTLTVSPHSQESDVSVG